MSAAGDDDDDLDQFEIHRKFLGMLRNKLSASKINEISVFAYQHHAQHESLFQGLLEVMVQTVPLSRLNLFYVVDSLCKSSQPGQTGYIDLTRTHLMELIEFVVDCVRGTDGTVLRKPHREGASNIGHVRKVINIWRSKQIISGEAFDKAEAFLAAWQEQANELRLAVAS